MATEIRILVQAARKGCAVVEKSSRVLWAREELERAKEEGFFALEDRLAAPPEVREPGASDMSQYHLVGQTRHFLIFVPMHEAIG